MNWAGTDSVNGLPPVRHQAITQTNADLLSIRPLEPNLSEIMIKVPNFSFMKMHLKIPSKMATILSSGRWVKTASLDLHQLRDCPSASEINTEVLGKLNYSEYAFSWQNAVFSEPHK